MECLLYNIIYNKSLLGLVIVFFRQFSKIDKKYNRYCIKIQSILGINPKVILEETATALGPNALSYPTVIGWGKRFREDREDINDDPRSGRLVCGLPSQIIELFERFLRMILIQFIVIL